MTAWPAMTPASGTPVEGLGQQQQAAALGPGRQAGAHLAAQVVEQRAVGGEGGAVHFGKPAADEQSVDGLAGAARCRQRVEGDDLRPGRLQGVEGVGVGEGEGRDRRPRATRIGGPGAGQRHRPGRRCGRRAGQGHDGVQIDVAPAPTPGESLERAADLGRAARPPAPGPGAGRATGGRRRGAGRRGRGSRAAARASRSMASWVGEPTWLRTTPAIGTSGLEGGVAVDHGGHRVGHGRRRRPPAGPGPPGAGPRRRSRTTVPSPAPSKRPMTPSTISTSPPAAARAGEGGYRARRRTARRRGCGVGGRRPGRGSPGR